MRAMPPRFSGESRLDKPQVLLLLRNALDSAATQVRASSLQSDSSGAARQLEVDLDLSFFRDAIESALLNGEEVDRELDLPVLPGHVPSRHLLEQLRRTLLQQLRGIQSQVGASQVLRALVALDHVHAALDQLSTTAPARSSSRVNSVDLLVEAAHDMRSPISSILFLVDMMRRGQSGKVSRRHQQQLALVYSAAFGLSTLADDLIDLARGSGRLVGAEPEPVDVSEIVGSVSDIVHPIAEEKQLELRVTAPDVGYRMGHPLALHRVLLNLATNALKFTHEGSVHLAVTPLDEDHVEFSVCDTGPGIPCHVMNSLFAPFRQHQSPNGGIFSSAGLGLAICRTLVEAMGGQLCVETAEGVGTRFRTSLALPVANGIPRPTVRRS